MSVVDNDFIEALSHHVEHTIGNTFVAYLGIDFIDDIKRSIVGKVHIVDHSTLTIACIDGKKLTFVIKPKEGCIEVVFPELDTGAKKGRIEMKRQSRAGVLKPKYAHMWKSYITLTYAKYNVAHS